MSSALEFGQCLVNFVGQGVENLNPGRSGDGHVVGLRPTDIDQVWSIFVLRWVFTIKEQCKREICRIVVRILGRVFILTVSWNRR